MTSALDIAGQWPGKLQKIDFASPEPNLPSNTQIFLRDAGLPKMVAIEAYVDSQIEFYETGVHLSNVWAEELERGVQLHFGDQDPETFPGEWNKYWKIGDEKWTQGGAWICIEERTGHLVAINLDADEPISLMNYSLLSFLAALDCAIKWTDKYNGNIDDTPLLTKALSLHPVLKEGEIDSYWGNLIESTVDYGCEHLRIMLK